MDDSSQNDPGIQQKPTTETNSSYPQYPAVDPINKPQKRRNPLIFVAAGILLLLVLVSAALFIHGKHGQSSKNAAACADQTCFSQHFSKCLPAEYTDNASKNSSIKYTITGTGEIGCNVKVEYVKSKLIPDAVGKKMTCDFDNSQDFNKAANNVFYFPDDYACQGDLAGLFKT